MMNKRFATRFTLSIAGALGAAILLVTPINAAGQQHDHGAPASAGLVKVTEKPAINPVRSAPL